MTSSSTSSIACRQILQKDGAVFSAQWTVLPAPAFTADLLLERYLKHIRRFTLGLVRPRRTAGEVDFRFFGLSLLRFRALASGARPGEDAVTLSICGGALVHPQNCSQGELTFSCQPVPGGTRVSLQLADYCPLLLGGAPVASPWRRQLYRLTQAAIHRLATIRFLRRLHRELAGGPVCCRVIRVRQAGDEEI